jgi:hypothetical protein
MVSNKLEHVIRTSWCNVAGWIFIAKQVFLEYLEDCSEAYWDQSNPLIEDFKERLDYKYEDEDYDDYE